MPTNNTTQQYILWLWLCLCKLAASAPTAMVASDNQPSMVALGNSYAYQNGTGGNDANKDSPDLSGFWAILITVAVFCAFAVGAYIHLVVLQRRRSDVAELHPSSPPVAPLYCPTCTNVVKFKPWVQNRTWLSFADEEAFCPIAQSTVGDAVPLPCCSGHAGKVGLEMWQRKAQLERLRLLDAYPVVEAAAGVSP